MRKIQTLVNIAALGLLLGATNSYSETITYIGTTYNLREVNGTISSQLTVLSSQPWWIGDGALGTNDNLLAAGMLDKFIGKRFAYGTVLNQDYFRNQTFWEYFLGRKQKQLSNEEMLASRTAVTPLNTGGSNRRKSKKSKKSRKLRTRHKKNKKNY